MFCKIELNEDYIREKVLETDKKRQTFCNKQCLDRFREKKVASLSSFCVTCDQLILKSNTLSDYIELEGYSNKIRFCNEACMALFDESTCKSDTFYKIKINSFLLSQFFDNRHTYLLSGFKFILNKYYNKTNQRMEVIYHAILLALPLFLKAECNLSFNSDVQRLNYFLAIVNDRIYLANKIIERNKKVVKHKISNNQIEGQYVNTKDKALLAETLKDLL